MLIQRLADCPEFTAGDQTQLRELLHPDKLYPDKLYPGQQPLALRYSLAHAVLPVGQTSLPHTLQTSEVYYVLSGTGEMHIDAAVQVIQQGDTVYIPPQARQFVCNIGSQPLVFLCIVDPAWRAEDERVEQAAPEL